MGLLNRKKSSLEDLEDKKEYLTIESEVVSREAEVAEKEAIIKELRDKYGSNWKDILGLRGKLNLQTLRSVLAAPKAGLRGMAGAFGNPNLSSLPPRILRR